MKLLLPEAGVSRRRGSFSFEDAVFAGLGVAVLAGWLIARLPAVRLHEGNARVRYGFEHLAGALLASFLFMVLAGGARWWLSRAERIRELPTIAFVAGIAGCFSLFWLPAVMAGGFDKDDWMLLAAASVRKVLAGHPLLAWNTLDSVDGNFRPLGTVLYVGVMLRQFGVWARPFLLGLFAVNLLGSLVAFALVRALGYSRMAAAAGALLYLSRSQLYSIVTWTCALGDALVILLCGSMALALLAAIERPGWRAAPFHVAAWGCFCAATLSKQSAFAAPLIVGLLLGLRPGARALRVPGMQRLWSAIVGVAAYGATAAVPFLHAKHLLASPSPYPIAFSFTALLRVFGYATWYFGTFEFPIKYVRLQTLPSLVGVVLVTGVAVLIARVPRLLGERPRDVVFCLSAAASSVSLFVVLPARVAPYYGSMAAFWVSIGLGIALTRFGWANAANFGGRVCCFLFCVLLVVGFADVRLKQTGLLPSGGYTWGASEVGLSLDVYQDIQRGLSLASDTETLVLEEMPNYEAYFAGMAMTANPALPRILTYRKERGTYLANDRGGLVPADDLAELRNPRAYNWNVPLSANDAARLLAHGRVLRLKFHDGKIESGN